ncbi:hypothetical protein D3C72_1076510 [compost metagenome]
MAAAERNHIAGLQAHGLVLEPHAVDEGAVGAAQVLQPRRPRLQEQVRMAARKVVDLMRIVVAIAREGVIGLADEEREARDDHRLQADFRADRRERDGQTWRLRRRGPRIDAHAVRQRRAKAHLVAIAQQRRLLGHGIAIHARAVLAAEVRHVDGAVLGKNARVAARKYRDRLRRIGDERRLATADGEQILPDPDLAEFGPGHGHQQDVERLPRSHRHFHDQGIVARHVSTEPTVGPVALCRTWPVFLATGVREVTRMNIVGHAFRESIRCGAALREGTRQAGFKVETLCARVRLRRYVRCRIHAVGWRGIADGGARPAATERLVQRDGIGQDLLVGRQQRQLGLEQRTLGLEDLQL